MQPGTSQERTEEVLKEVDNIIASHPAVESRTQILGFSFIGGQGNTYGSFIVKLKDWDERPGKGMDANSVLGAIYMKCATEMKGCPCIVFRSAYDSGVQYW